MASGWDRLSADPSAPDAGSMRASDADRDAVLELLREAYAEGRLDTAEYERRVDGALRVVVMADVVPLLSDVIRREVPSRRSSAHAEAVETFRREDRDARNGALGVTVLTTGIWGATSIGSGELLFFWPVFPAVALWTGWFLHRMNREQRIETLEEQAADRRRRLED